MKMGRTQLEDAVPIALGREFKVYAMAINRDVRRLHQVKELFCRLIWAVTRSVLVYPTTLIIELPLLKSYVRLLQHLLRLVRIWLMARKIWMFSPAFQHA